MCRIRGLSSLFSLILISATLLFVCMRGINWGIDFVGGVNMEVESSQPIHDLREKSGNLISSIQETGKGKDGKSLFLIKTDKQENMKIIKERLGGEVKFRRTDVVGPRFGADLFKGFLIAIPVALLCMWLYVAYAFGVKWSNWAVAGLVHDLLIILGLYCTLGMEFDERVMVGMLGTIGYSVNNTIVIFGAIREGLRDPLYNGNFEGLVWQSIINTLRRTILTSLTTLAALIVICVCGGSFSSITLPFLVGVVAGTYSSICLVAPYLALFGAVAQEEP